MDEQPKYLTLKEAAEKFRITPNRLARFARKHGCCAEFGRKLLFTEQDLHQLFEIHRIEATAPRPPVKPFPSHFQTMRRLRELTSKKRKREKPG